MFIICLYSENVGYIVYSGEEGKKGRDVKLLANQKKGKWKKNPFAGGGRVRCRKEMAEKVKKGTK